MKKNKIIIIIILLAFLIIASIAYIVFLSNELSACKVRALECRVEIAEIQSKFKKSKTENVLLQNRLQRKDLLLESKDLENQIMLNAIQDAKYHIDKEQRNAKSTYADKAKTINNIKDELRFVGY